jgi:hypothetical protein
MNSIVKFDSDDLIYNRFDLIHTDSYENYEIEDDKKVYRIQASFDDSRAKLNIWGKAIPYNVMKEVVSKIFLHQGINTIEVTRTVNEFEGFLYEQNDFRVPLPDNVEELLARVERRDRATIRRKKRWLDERVGTLDIIHYERKIPKEIVEKYFEWKKNSHGTDYKLSADEYIRKYYVTDALVVKAGEEFIGIAFYCACEANAFFENFSFNEKYREYSPGLLTYEILLEHLISRNIKFLYMAGGNYSYKRRFGSEETSCYSGNIYKADFLSKIKTQMDALNISQNIAIYGYGKFGHVYEKLLNKLGYNVLYAIDMNAEYDGEITIRRPDENLDDVFDVIITIENRNEAIENTLKNKGKRYIYITELLEISRKSL